MSRYLLALVTAAGFLTACGDSPTEPDTDPPPATVAEVEVDGPRLDLAPGESIQLTARALDPDGQVVTGRAFTWQSDDPSVAAVSSDGLVTAVTSGEVTISATTGLVTGGVFLTVSDDALPAVAWIDVEPGGEVALAAGESLQLVATAHAADGEVLLGRTLTWETSDADVATVSATGVITAVASGDAWIAVVCEGQRDELLVRVPDIVDPPVPVDHVTLDYPEIIVRVGAPMQIVAQPRDVDGRPLDRPVTWTSSNPAYLSVSATGLVTALAVGSADITATSEGRSATVRLWSTHITDYTLTAVGGGALPAHLVSFTDTLPDGSTVVRTVRLYDGWLSIDEHTQTYEVMLHGTISTQGQSSWIPVPISYESAGSVAWDESIGELVFTPADPGPGFTARPVETGLLVRWQPDDRMTGLAAFLFTTD
ncbi:MAG TPA: Ig-like domain-containing protein [Kofleriaceae bacterium]|nr:Ig-like domain-containing protein [Kofleriaceae bacterium]